MKKFFCFILILALLAAFVPAALASGSTVTTSDPNAALDEFLALPDWPVVEEEDNNRKGETIYPDEFAGMYVGDDGVLVVCVTQDTPEIEQYYRDIMPNIPELRFQTATHDYNTLQHFMIVIEQRHVSSNLLVVTMYKIKDYYINYQENRIDIRMYSDLEYDSIIYLQGIFGDAIYIEFCDTTGEVDLYDQDFVLQRQADEDAASAAAQADAEPAATLAQEVSDKAEETGFSVRAIAIPIIIVVLAVVVFFLYSKLRSRKTKFDDDDYIDK